MSQPIGTYSGMPATSVSHKKTVMILLLVIAGMVGLVAASVPLYRLFCQVTGYGGTPKIDTNATENVILDRQMTVRFNADISPDLPWYFKPEQHSVTVKVGEEALIFYKAVNNSDKPVSGTATFNVTPHKAGQYFTKIECFCFTEQTLAPGQSVDMPVTFFVDPEIVENKHLVEVKEITLSYTFFPMTEDE